MGQKSSEGKRVHNSYIRLGILPRQKPYQENPMGTKPWSREKNATRIFNIITPHKHEHHISI